jgi:hypothetical protein
LKASGRRISRGGAEVLRRGEEEGVWLGLALCVSASLQGSVQQDIFLWTIHTTGDAILEHRFAKVEQVSEFQAGEPEIGLHLFLVRGICAFDRFYFQQHSAPHDEVSPEAFLETEIPVNNR